jgi:hypothetical protein
MRSEVVRRSATIAESTPLFKADQGSLPHHCHALSRPGSAVATYAFFCTCVKSNSHLPGAAVPIRSRLRAIAIGWGISTR